MSSLTKYYETLHAGIKNSINISNVEGFNFEISNKCMDGNVVWGSEKPLKETCKPENLQMQGNVCMNIWNNSTKRKIIVN
tara:strand:+ start:927 stop:1166 length:240 start_codon:yes stop_codon:yes gene_type:complete